MTTQLITPDPQAQPPIEIEIIEAPSGHRQRPRVALVQVDTRPAQFIHLSQGEYKVEPRHEPKA